MLFISLKRSNILIRYLSLSIFVIKFNYKIFLLNKNNMERYFMHIMEGFLPPIWCLFWYILSIPVIAYGIIRIKKSN